MTQQELEKLYNESYKAVYWTAYSILKNQEDAEDVVQDTFLTAYERYDSLEDKSKAVAWIKKIAANKSLNIVTRKRTINVDDEDLEDTEAIGEDFLPDSMIESAESRKVIMDIINNTLSEDTAMTLILFYFDEMSIKEIAELLNIPQGTVLSRLNYAKKKIKKEVEKYEKDNKDKLFGMGVPFLTKLFEMEAEQVPFKPMPASILSLSASTKAATGAKVASTAGKATAAIVIRNVIVGVVAAALLGGIGIFAYNNLIKEKESHKSPKPKETSEDTEVSETEETKKTINVLGMTPDQLDLTGGYVRYCTVYDHKNDKETEDHQLYYDANGNMVLDCLFNEDGVVIYSDYFIYDDQGRVEREELWETSSANDRGHYYDYTYGANGVEKVDSGTFNKDAEEYYEYEYDISGRLIKVTEIKYKTGSCYWYCDYEYSDDGTYTTRVTAFDTLSQKMVQKKSYSTYTADGRLLEEYESGMKLKDVYTYDDDGVLLLMEHYDGSKLNWTTTYEYDTDGRLIHELKVYKSSGDEVEKTYEYKNI